MLYHDADRYAVHQIRMARRRWLEAKEQCDQGNPKFTQGEVDKLEREYREATSWAREENIEETTMERIDEFRNETPVGPTESKDPDWYSTGG